MFLKAREESDNFAYEFKNLARIRPLFTDLWFLLVLSQSHDSITNLERRNCKMKLFMGGSARVRAGEGPDEETAWARGSWLVGKAEERMGDTECAWSC